METTEDTIEKVYWRIGEIAEELNIQPTEIRFWEEAFGIKVGRNMRGFRKFDREERKLFHEINRLLNTELFTIAGAKRQLGLPYKIGAFAEHNRQAKQKTFEKILAGVQTSEEDDFGKPEAWLSALS